MIHPSLLVFGLVTAFLMVLGGAAFRKAPPLLGCKRTSKNFTCIVSLVLMLVVYSCVIRNRIGYYVLYIESDVAVCPNILVFILHTLFFLVKILIFSLIMYLQYYYISDGVIIICRSYAYWMLTLNCIV